MIRTIQETLAGTPWGDDEQGVERAIERIATGPDPTGTATRLARVLPAAPALASESSRDPLLAEALVAVCSSGRALTAALTALGDDALEPLRWASPPAPRIEAAGSDPGLAIRRGVRRHMLGIAALDLTRRIDMPAAGIALADLADAAADAALRSVARPGDPSMAVVALGKWGGRELNYASDIDLVFVHEGDEAALAARLAERFIAILSSRTADGIAFRVDPDLRPEGRDGPLSRTVESFRAYWERWAHTWERQAMLKARPAAGDRALGAAFVEASLSFVHPEVLPHDAVREIRAMKLRSERLVSGAADELKRGVGGIRDIEFAVQLLQLVHGGADPLLRSANTLDALARLGSGGYVDPADTEELSDSYRWLRDLEHRIQLQDLRQTHTVPGGGAARERIAKLMGYRDRPDASAVEAFEGEMVERRSAVRDIHQRLFYRPALEAFASARRDGRIDRQMAALGFTDSEATRAAAADLTAGLSRRSRLMRQVLPLMMEWLSAAPDPDLGLAQLRLLVAGSGDNGLLIAALRDDPGVGERLCRLLGTARLAGRLVDRIPSALTLLGDDVALGTPPEPSSLRAEALGRGAIRPDHAETIESLHRFWGERLLVTMAADVAGLSDVQDVGRRLSDAADALVEALLAAAIDEVGAGGLHAPPMAVIAMGSWGGRELTYAGDLDALVVFDPDAGDEEAASRVAEVLVGSLAAPSPGVSPPAVDLDLRPEGRKGALTRSLAAYEAYWDRWALTWEFQSLLRARFAAGDAALGDRFVAAATVRAHPASFDADREVRSMKLRVEKERIPLGEDPDFHVKLGKGALSDVEWTVQLLQMRHGHAHPAIRTPATLEALQALARGGLVRPSDAAALEAAYLFCARVRNRLALRAGRTFDSLPTDPDESAALARSLGYEISPRTALREEYRRVTRRARKVVDRVFYGRS